MESRPAAPASDADRLFDYIQQKGVEFDTVFSYAEVEEIVARPRSILQGLVRRLNPRLGKAHHRYLKSVPKEGWRIVRPEEHVGVGHEHVDRAKRQMNRAVAVVAHADGGAMTPAERDRNDLTLSGLRAMQRQVQDSARRIRRLESIQVQQSQALVTHDERLAEIQRQIDEIKGAQSA